jgi:Fur family ferric uptake transcriptional regulator
LKQRQLVHDESKVWEYDIVQFFEKKGVRWTPQRQLVLDALQRSEGHISAEEIHHQIIRQFPKVNLSTIYRTLEMLCEMGVMVEVVTRNDDRKRFELVGELPHHHLICRGCGVVMELEEIVIQRLKAETLERYGFKLELNHFVGYGCCKPCAESGFHLQ